jgi:ASPIC/UnbV protein
MRWASDARRKRRIREKSVGDSVVKLTAAGETQTEILRSGSSYLSASELALTFGLARHD